MAWDNDPRDQIAEIYEDDFGGLLRAFGLHGLTSLVLKTPVDTGRLRGGWAITIGRASDANSTRLDKAGSSTISSGKTQIANANFGDVLILQNNVEYGIFINDGTPRIRPHRMVERTADELQNLF